MPALDALTPISHPAAARASGRRAAEGAPDARVIPSRTCIPRDCARSLLLALGGLEEDREVVEPCVAQRRELRHRRAGVDARRAREVANLEVDAEVARADVGEVRRAEVGRPRAE